MNKTVIAWYGGKEPFVGAKWDSMGTIGEKSFKIVYECPDRMPPDFSLWVRCNTTEERDWVFYRAFAITHSKPYTKGLQKRLRELSQEYVNKKEVE